MRAYMLIERLPDGHYTASLPGWPGMIAQGATEDEAVATLCQQVEAQRDHVRIRPIAIGVPIVPEAWSCTNDPFAAEFDAVIAANRRELDDPAVLRDPVSARRVIGGR